MGNRQLQNFPSLFATHNLKVRLSKGKSSNSQSTQFSITLCRKHSQGSIIQRKVLKQPIALWNSSLFQTYFNTQGPKQTNRQALSSSTMMLIGHVEPIAQFFLSPALAHTAMEHNFSQIPAKISATYLLSLFRLLGECLGFWCGASGFCPIPLPFLKRRDVASNYV